MCVVDDKKVELDKSMGQSKAKLEAGWLKTEERRFLHRLFAIQLIWGSLLWILLKFIGN